MLKDKFKISHCIAFQDETFAHVTVFQTLILILQTFTFKMLYITHILTPPITWS